MRMKHVARSERLGSSTSTGTSVWAANTTASVTVAKTNGNLTSLKADEPGHDRREREREQAALEVLDHAEPVLGHVGPDADQPLERLADRRHHRDGGDDEHAARHAPAAAQQLQRAPAANAAVKSEPHEQLVGAARARAHGDARSRSRWPRR